VLLQNRIEAFTSLGDFLRQFSRKNIEQNNTVLHNELFFDVFKLQIKRAQETNGWFTKDNVLHAFEGLSKLLINKNLNNWTSSYSLNNSKPKTIAVIMAGNIPLVGFHDFLSVLLSNNKVVVKQSSNDNNFLPLIAKYLEHVEPEFKGYIDFTEEKLTDFDAAIATGSNNTARYFEYYFGKHPNIIRKNRNTVAVLTGKETLDDLTNLGEDIFRYFGLGCRSVSKLFVPKGYNFDQLFEAIYSFNEIINYTKDHNYSSPIATLFYEYYDNLDELEEKLKIDSEFIQCIVSNTLKNTIPFGETQQPALTDYADGIDTMAFLSKL
jgi:hypothetical protein